MGPKTWMNSFKLAEANVKASLLKKKSPEFIGTKPN